MAEQENVLQTAGKAAASFWEEMKKLLTELLSAFLIFVLLIFVLGELYAAYFMRAENPLLLWAPVVLLMAVLFYRVLE